MPDKDADMIYHSSTDTLFYNSQCLFIEFHDVISMPWFILANVIKNDKAFMSVFKTNELYNYTKNDMFEWYIYRKHRNIFQSIGVQKKVYKQTMNKIPDNFYDNFLKNCMTASASLELYSVDTTLLFYKSLQILLSETPNMVKRIIIYSEYEEKGIKYFINNLLKFNINPMKVEYVYGNFKDIIKDIPNDSTYVLSDIEKVQSLKELNKLHLSSLLIVNGLRYNYKLDNINQLKIDFKELSNEVVFKYSFFDNFVTFKANEKYDKIINKKSD